MARTAFVGLGVMGHPMAGHLVKHGHEVAVFNRTYAKAEAWAAEYGGRACRTPREAAAGAELVLCMVGDDPDVRAVAAPALDAMKPGAVLVDHTTASAGLARALAERAEAAGRGFLDAPVSGGQAGAQAGTMTVMASGSAAAFGDSARYTPAGEALPPETIDLSQHSHPHRVAAHLHSIHCSFGNTSPGCRGGRTRVGGALPYHKALPTTPWMPRTSRGT